MCGKTATKPKNLKATWLRDLFLPPIWWLELIWAFLEHLWPKAVSRDAEKEVCTPFLSPKASSQRDYDALISLAALKSDWIQYKIKCINEYGGNSSQASKSWVIFT